MPQTDLLVIPGEAKPPQPVVGGLQLFGMKATFLLSDMKATTIHEWAKCWLIEFQKEGSTNSIQTTRKINEQFKGFTKLFGTEADSPRMLAKTWYESLGENTWFKTLPKDWAPAYTKVLPIRHNEEDSSNWDYRIYFFGVDRIQIAELEAKGHEIMSAY